MDETTRALDAWAAAKRQIASRLAWRAWAGQEAAPPNLLLFRTLKRVHLRSPSAIAQWLAQVTANTDRVVRDAR